MSLETEHLGRSEVYVRPFPDAGSGQWQVSDGGGMRLAWARSSHELFFRNLTGAIMSVSVDPGVAWTASVPTQLFELAWQEELKRLAPAN